MRNFFYNRQVVCQACSLLTNFTLLFLTINALGMLSRSQVLFYNRKWESLQNLQAGWDGRESFETMAFNLDEESLSSDSFDPTIAFHRQTEVSVMILK